MPRAYPQVTGGCTCADTPVAARWFQRVLLIVLENQDYRDAAADPYLAGLARAGANFTDFHGLAHPSYPNYLAMVTGRLIPTLGDRQRDVHACTVGDLLEARGLSWRNYAQGYPAPVDLHAYPGGCDPAVSIGRYARKHVPFMSFVRIRRHACGNIVAASRFADDAVHRRLPAYAFFSPDMDNDGHDTGLAYASRWLQGFLEPLRRDPAFMQGTLVVVTFDESRDYGTAAGNRIFTVFLGPMVKPGEVTARYDHFSVLRTIERNFGLCSLGPGDAGARAITTVWK